MKKLKISFFLFFIFTISLHAQRYADLKTASISTGWINEGFNVGLDYEIMRNNKSFVFELNYMFRNSKLQTSSEKVKLNDFSTGVKYRFYKPYGSFYPFISIGGLVGLESISKKNVPPSIYVTRKDGFFWGVSYDLGAEYSFVNSSITLAYKPFYDFTHKEYNHGVNLGYKIYF